MTAEFVTAPDLAVPHGFFTRNGGVSTGPFASLNCSLSGQDARDHVLENRARVARALGAGVEVFDLAIDKPVRDASLQPSASTREIAATIADCPP